VQLIPILILAVLLVGVMLWTRRNRARNEMADATRRQNLQPGSQVMTTSGLYATVVSVDHADDSVQLLIAPGVEVKWTIAALRSVTELPPRYREAIDSPTEPGD